jgi:kynurenine 3-monooxygenase
VSRGELNRVMLNEAEKLPGVKLHFEHRCTGVHLDTGTCSFHNELNGENVAVPADVVFGSDGAPSAVRQEMMKGRFNFSQSFIEHDYKEIAFPSKADGSPQMWIDVIRRDCPEALRVPPTRRRGTTYSS